jgi:hypothetical protein
MLVVMPPPDLLGLAETAALLGVEKSRIGKWRHLGVVLRDGRRVPFPEPVLELRATPLWRGRDIRALRRHIKRIP